MGWTVRGSNPGEERFSRPALEPTQPPPRQCVKGKATPFTGLGGPEGSGRLRLQITRHSTHEGGQVITLTHRPPLPPGISWYSFLEVESTPGTWTCRTLRKKNPQWHDRGSIPGPSDLYFTLIKNSQQGSRKSKTRTTHRMRQADHTEYKAVEP